MGRDPSQPRDSAALTVSQRWTRRLADPTVRAVDLAAFDYDLPAGAIASEPLEPRDAARLLVHERASGATRHRRVADLGGELRAGDLLVLNDTRVIPARVLGRRATGGRIEFLFLEPAPEGGGVWRAMVRGAQKLRPSEPVSLAEGVAIVPLAREGESAVWRVTADAAGASVPEVLARFGTTPLPPYIEREATPRDADRYQTIYAEKPGAVAAPTAGLHFTPELFAALEARGIERATVTLHVGAGTFLPVTASRVEDHVMHDESYVLPSETAVAVARCRARGGRVVAVGTTTVRVLESCADGSGRVEPGEGRTRLFLVPGARFRAVDALLTNFHLPKSTLLMLVAAFAGRERTLALYREALARGYRFFSYGDAMLLLP